MRENDNNKQTGGDKNTQEKGNMLKHDYQKQRKTKHETGSTCS